MLGLVPGAASSYTGRAVARHFRVAPTKAPRQCTVQAGPATKWWAILLAHLCLLYTSPSPRDRSLS
eukprot:3025867-Pyramimonas_sp.AAC.1